MVKFVSYKQDKARQVFDFLFAYLMQLKFVSCKQDKARQDGAITIDLFGHCKCNGLAVTQYCAVNNGFVKFVSCKH